MVDWIRGRRRDTGIDERVLEVARRHLSRDGFGGLSVAAVAAEAGTTRQALYRRWPTKADLASAVIGTIETPAADAPPATADPLRAARRAKSRTRATTGPFAALVAEFTDFARGVSRPGRISLVGAMLQENAHPDVVGRYRARVIAPRRSRIAAILHEAQQQGLIDADADLDVAVTMGTGSWYGRALAGDPPPPDWPERAARLVWRAVGGTTPDPDDQTR